MRRVLLILLGVVAAGLVAAFLAVGLFPPKPVPHAVERSVSVDTIAPPPPPPPEMTPAAPPVPPGAATAVPAPSAAPAAPPAAGSPPPR